MKLYINNSMKYNNNLYNIFQRKIQIFWDYYEKIKLEATYYNRVFSFILYSKAC
jgi:hypothetical protein